MKLLYLTHFPLDINAPTGGVEAVNSNLVQSIAKIPGIQIDVVCFADGINTVKIIENDGFNVHYLPKSMHSELMHAVYYGKKYLTEYIKDFQYDLIHAHDTYGIISSGIKSKKVFTIHGFIYGDTLVSGGRLSYLRSKLWKYYEVGGWERQDNIISISPYVRERVVLLTKNRNIYDIDNPVSREFFEIKNVTTERVIIFSAAVISRRKNTLLLVKAVEELKKKGINVELRLAGPIIEQDYGELIIEYIRKNNLTENVTLLGSVGREQVMMELSRATIFALVSLEENSPMGIEEAMAAGVPVVTSNRCGMPYLVKHGESGYLVDPLDVDDIAVHMQKIVQQKELHTTMSKSCRQTALWRFHPDKIAEQTVALYKEIMER